EMKAKLTGGLKEKVKIEKELDRYSGVDEKIENAKTKLRELEPNYWLYKKNKDLAEEIGRYLKEYEDLKRKRQEIENRLQSLFREVEVLKGQYNQERYENLRKECESALEKKHKLDAELRGKKKNLEELTNKIQRLQNRKEEKDELEKDLKEEECLLNFLEKIRDIFNKAPDRLTEVYLERINREANLRFQELFGEPNLELRWENDFGITVREGPHEKYFGQLSGGQQMCAALAVRLALLRYLSDVNLAFFDEPTQNLDLERRENLAEAIRNIKGFRQLFIISHDETFHDLVENTIFLKNEDGKTEVVSEL
ncbi:MAG TPA: hypothetical protein EYP29_03710, partial [Thermoplasmata archaeon]|nr:hypothetical protein [Thermoplasmata archaeon]